MSLLWSGLTIASLAALPILIGLAVDYAIQFQSRVREADEDRSDRAGAVRTAARAGAPTIAVAALATACGFLVLRLSPVPMVQDFGRADRDRDQRLRWRARSSSARPRPRSRPDPARSRHRCAGRVRSSPVILGLTRASRRERRASARGRRRRPARRRRSPVRRRGLARRRGWVLAAAVALALVGWVADSGLPVADRSADARRRGHARAARARAASAGHRGLRGDRRARPRARRRDARHAGMDVSAPDVDARALRSPRRGVVRTPRPSVPACPLRTCSGPVAAARTPTAGGSLPRSRASPAISRAPSSPPIAVRRSSRSGSA